jgi:hypothetical protein
MSQVIKLIPIFIYLHKTLNRLGSRILKKYTCKSIHIEVFNATFNNISVLSWHSILLVEETGENHQPAASHWQTLS